MTAPHVLGIPLSAILVLEVMLAGKVNTTASTEAASKVKVLIAFTHQPGPAEQSLVRSFGGKVKYTYQLVSAIVASVAEAALQGLRCNPLTLRGRTRS